MAGEALSDEDIWGSGGASPAPANTMLSDADIWGEQKPEPTMGDKALRQAGLLYRAGVEGATALPTMIGNIPAATANLVRAGGDKLLGIDQSSPDVPYVAPFSQGLDVLGAPKPETKGERLENAVVSSLTGAGAGIGLGREALQGGTTLLGPKMAAAFASQPKTQLASAITGGIGSDLAQESGDSPLGVIGTGLAASLAPQAAMSVPSLIRSIMTGKGVDPQANLAAFAAAGATPSVGQVTEGRIPQALESILSKVPGGAGIMSKRAGAQAEDIGQGVEDLASTLAKKTDSSSTGRAIEKGVTEDFIPKARATQKSLYDKLDIFIPSDSEHDVSNTLNILKDINEPIPGAEALSQTKLMKNGPLQELQGAAEKDMGGVPAQPSPILGPNGQPLTSAAIPPKTTLPYSAIKTLRTRIGEQLSDFQLASDVPRAQLKRLYGALTQDMEGAAKSAGPDAYNAFNRANSYTSALHDRIDLLQNVVDKAGGPEKIFQAAMSGTREGATTLNAVMKSLPQDGQKMMTANVFRRLGIANPSNQNDLGSVFSTQTFLTNWNKLSSDAKQALFARQSPQFRADLDKIANVTSNLRDGSKVFVNPSGTASSTAAIGTLGAFLTSLATGNPLGAAAIGGGVTAANFSARAMTNPTFVRWMAKNAEKPISALPAAVNQLSQIADNKNDPELKDIAKSIPAKPQSIQTPIVEQKPQSQNAVPPSFQSEEGFKPSVYKDTTGHKTVGIGFNMDSGIARDVWQSAGVTKDFNAVRSGQQQLTKDEAQKLLGKSYEIAQSDIKKLVPNIESLPEKAQEGLTQLAFQHGYSSLKGGLPGVIASANQGNMQAAAARLLASDYAKKYRPRALRIARMMAG